MLQEILENQGRTDIDISSLPICCNGMIDIADVNFFDRCKADDVTNAAHDIFEMTGITPKQLAFLDAELSEGNTATLLKEEDPTAYLLRRNYATQMCLLGLSNAEMQYLMGHDVEDAYESRNEFVDSDRIYSMYLKLQRREIVNGGKRVYNKAEISIRGGETVKIHISAKEPTDSVSFSISDTNRSEHARINWFEEVKPFSGDRTVLVLDNCISFETN